MEAVSVMDIGTSKISVLMGNRGINNTLNILSSYDHEYAGYYNGEFVDEENLEYEIAKAITSAESISGKKIRKLFIGVPAEFSICKQKNIVQNFGRTIKVDDTDILSVYQQSNELEEDDNFILISCSPIYFILDDGRKTINPIGEKTCRISGEISYIYAEKSFITKINSCLKNLGLSCVEYISSVLAESTYIIPNKSRECAVLIDCGFITTSVSVLKGGGLTLLKSFSMGGDQITTDLKQCLGISYKQAQELKNQIILSVVPALSDGYEINKNGNISLISMVEANEIVCARLEMLCNMINKCLSSVSKKDIVNMPIYLTGGGICFIKGTKDYLSKYFGMNIEILSPPSLQLSKPNYSTVLGLLNSAIGQEEKIKNNKFINFFKKLTRR